MKLDTRDRIWIRVTVFETLYRNSWLTILKTVVLVPGSQGWQNNWSAFFCLTKNTPLPNNSVLNICFWKISKLCLGWILSQKRGFYIQYGAKVWDCEMAPLEIYCYHRPLLHLFAWIRLYSVSSRLEFLFPQKKGRKQAHIFSGTFEVCLIFCKIAFEQQLSNVKRRSIRKAEICL